MSARVSVPGLSDDENRLVNGLLGQLGSRRPRNELRSGIYDGKNAANQVGTIIPPEYYQMAMVLGWAAKGVDGLARRCVLDRMVWAGGDLEALGIRELEDSNFLKSELSQARTDSLLHGVSYLITTRGVEGEPAALVHAKDALNATGEWNARRRRLDSLLSVTSWKGDRPDGFVLYLDGVTISAGKSGVKWAVERSEHDWGVPVEPLIYRPRSSRRMGRSRINRPVISIQKAAVRAAARLEAHMDLYTVPQLFIFGAGAEAFKNPDGSTKNAWQIAYGRAFALEDDNEGGVANPRADVKRFDAASPASHHQQLNVLAKMMARELDLPDSDFAFTDMANPTSEGSYAAGRENLVAEAEGATDDWSPAIRKTVTRALAIQNGEASVPDEWNAIDVKWRSPLYLSRAAEADAGAKQIGAVPWLAETEVGLELLGLDEQQIQRALADKSAAERRVAGRDVVAALAAKSRGVGA